MNDNALKLVRGILSGHTWSDDEGLGIWSLISALRGPDSGDGELKERTTWRLRRAINPEFFVGFSDGPHPRPDKPRAEESPDDFYDRVGGILRASFPDAEVHFLRHYIEACWYFWNSQKGTARASRKKKATK